MNRRAPFTLCRLERGEKTYWYALFRNPESGERSNKKSVEVLKKQLGHPCDKPIRRRDEAMRICQEALDRNIVFNTFKDQDLRSYLQEFWNFDTSRYIAQKNAVNPGAIGKDYAYTRSIVLTRHVLPYLPASLRLSTVKMHHLKDLQYALIKSGTLANATINIAMSTVMIPLRNAQEEGVIPQSTIGKLPTLRNDQHCRGILTEVELTRVLTYMQALSDQGPYLACAVAVVTGMRSGELRALEPSQIQDGLIIVDQALSNIAGKKAPKGKRIREVPCPLALCNALRAYCYTNPYRCKETLVFWSNKGGGAVSSHYFSRKFQEAIIASHVMDVEELERRNVTFHSLRHMANSMLRGSIDEHLLRLTIGHSSSEMSDVYTHMTEQSRHAVEQAQRNNILPFIPGLDAATGS